MHPSAMALMTARLDELARHEGFHPMKACDVGALNINGCFRELIESRGCKYLGVDLAMGPNVDFQGRIADLRPNQFDLVISGNTLEHDRMPWQTCWDIVRALRPGGWAVLIAPFVWPVHCEPDLWRFTGEGLRTLLTWRSTRWCRVDKSRCGIEGKDAWAMARRGPSN